MTVTQRAEMSTQSINDLPDSDFAFVGGGGTKDSSGRTVPRSLRHFPIHDAAHVRNALARLPQSDLSDADKAKAQSKIMAAAKRLGIDSDGDSDGGSASRQRPEWRGRVYPLEDIHIVRSVNDRDGRIVEAYATVFEEPAAITDDQGRYLEVIDRSAFNKVLADVSRSSRGIQSVKVMFNHGRNLDGNPSDKYLAPIGVPVDIRPESRGLLTRTRYARTQEAEQILSLIEDGAITSQSFTGRIVRSSPELAPGQRSYQLQRGQRITVRRMELGLREYGPVLWPAYSGAEILGVRMSTPDAMEPDMEDEALPQDEEAAAGEPPAAERSDEHSARYHQHRLFVLRSREARERAGLNWLPVRRESVAMATLKEKQDEMARIKADLKRMEEDETVTEEDAGDLRDTLVERWEQLDAECKPIIERMERVRGITRAAESPANREDGADGPQRTAELMRKLDPFDNIEAVRGNMVRRDELVSRALSAIERDNRRGRLSDGYAEAATQKAQYRPDISRHLLLTGSDEYQEAFRTYLEDPIGQGREATRALALATGSAGFMLPYVLDPTIILTSNGSTNPYRQLATVQQTTSNAWQGVNSAGVTAALLAEAANAPDASPAMGQIQIFPQKFAAWVFGSFELIGDTNFADQLPGLLADAKDIVEETQFAIGTGGTGNSAAPQGVLTALGTAQKVAANQGTGGAFAGTGTQPALDVYNLQAALGPRFRKSRSVGWVANITNINKLRGLDQYGGSSFWANFGDDTPEQLLGKPIHESPSITTTGATGTGTGSAALLYGDWSKMIVVDRVGTSMIYEPMITGTGSGANLPTGQSGWFYYWRAGSGVATANAFRWLANGS